MYNQQVNGPRTRIMTSSSELKGYKLTSLKLDGTNWHLWRQDVVLASHALGIHQLLEPATKADDLSVAQQSNLHHALNQAMDNNNRIMTMHCKSPEQVWKTLKDHYESRYATDILILTERFQQISLSDPSKITLFLDEIKLAHNALITAGRGYSDDELTLQILLVSSQSMSTIYIVAAPTPKIIEDIGSAWSFQYSIKPAQELNYILGIRIRRNRGQGTIILDQETYANKVLERFKMADSKAVKTPAEPRTIADMENGAEVSYPYREEVGALMYLTTSTRPRSSIRSWSSGKTLTSTDAVRRERSQTHSSLFIGDKGSLHNIRRPQHPSGGLRRLRLRYGRVHAAVRVRHITLRSEEALWPGPVASNHA